MKTICGAAAIAVLLLTGAGSVVADEMDRRDREWREEYRRDRDSDRDDRRWSQRDRDERRDRDRDDRRDRDRDRDDARWSLRDWFDGGSSRRQSGGTSVTCPGGRAATLGQDAYRDSRGKLHCQ